MTVHNSLPTPETKSAEEIGEDLDLGALGDLDDQANDTSDDQADDADGLADPIVYIAEPLERTPRHLIPPPPPPVDRRRIFLTEEAPEEDDEPLDEETATDWRPDLRKVTIAIIMIVALVLEVMVAPLIAEAFLPLTSLPGWGAALLYTGAVVDLSRRAWLRVSLDSAVATFAIAVICVGIGITLAAGCVTAITSLFF